jgi:hypothetical protein
MIGGFIKKIRSLIATDKEVIGMFDQQKEKRRGLDKRLENIAIATLDGEWDWFLELKKVDPNCAVEVIKECKLNDES